MPGILDKSFFWLWKQLSFSNLLPKSDRHVWWQAGVIFHTGKRKKTPRLISNDWRPLQNSKHKQKLHYRHTAHQTLRNAAEFCIHCQGNPDTCIPHTWNLQFYSSGFTTHLNKYYWAILAQMHLVLFPEVETFRAYCWKHDFHSET